MNQTQKKGLAILRMGLGFFLLLWSIDKIMAPEATVKIFEVFYKIPISVQMAYGIGAIQALISVALMAGLWKNYTYLLGLLMHGVSTLSTYRQLLDPFGPNHLFIAAIPVLTGFIALYMMRELDTLWCVE